MWIPTDDGILRAKHTRCWDDSERERERGRDSRVSVVRFTALLAWLPDGLAGVEAGYL